MINERLNLKLFVNPNGLITELLDQIRKDKNRKIIYLIHGLKDLLYK